MVEKFQPSPRGEPPSIVGWPAGAYLASMDGAIYRGRSTPRPGPSNKSAPDGRWTRDFWIPHRHEILRIPVKELDLIRAERDYVRLHVGPNAYLLHQTISALEALLDPADFIRLHRSVIVRRGYIVGFKYSAKGAWTAHLADGCWQRVGRTYLANVRTIIIPTS
jgi:two-component system response regulator AlgR